MSKCAVRVPALTDECEVSCMYLCMYPYLHGRSAEWFTLAVAVTVRCSQPRPSLSQDGRESVVKGEALWFERRTERQGNFRREPAGTGLTLSRASVRGQR